MPRYPKQSGSRGYKGLRGVKRDYKGCRGLQELQGIIRGYRGVKELYKFQKKYGTCHLDFPECTLRRGGEVGGSKNTNSDVRHLPSLRAFFYC